VLFVPLDIKIKSRSDVSNLLSCLRVAVALFLFWFYHCVWSIELLIVGFFGKAK